ncbi:carboxypeptidase M32 [Engelhardtia mirabilis]|uniref:Metal-dependent carboxypeptidase n=1 Tax=Engelhardtia mirabilis TaxID=2528011 RepID=A0A518BFL1_9BACT|nr:Thermostable carboxypeptidase 1 [Planctomycetes bacterium Pla133]QDV00029.1 Thermostable carboxypeptidase 1 [Planctomycetes bacterium Pla86]
MPPKTKSKAEQASPTTTADLVELERRFAELADLGQIGSILSWDQQVMMPPGGAGSRATQMATLAGLVHERTTDPKLVALLKRLRAAADGLKPRERRMLHLAAKHVHRSTAIPEEMAREMAELESTSLEAWSKARAENDFKRFAPVLARTVELQREEARLLSGGVGDPYDALLDKYEPDTTGAEIDPLLDELVEITVPLVDRVRRSKVKVDRKPLVNNRFPAEAQRAFVREVVESMGIDLTRGRLDLSTHPFCGGIGPVDVRMTGRYDPRDLRGGLFGAIHEAGHGLYEQGLDPKRARSPLGGAISMGIHESQSRLWENMIGRSKPFWSHFLSKAKKRFPEALTGVKLDGMWRAANALAPSMIRVEADELTYNLHIALRYRIERELISGALAVKDLPARWNDEMQATLGVRPKNDTEGCLQDIHWSMGAFGYFPTYSLGNLYAAQFMVAAREAMPDLDAQVAGGNLLPLRAWLLEKIHRHDRTVTAGQLVKRVTGAKLSVRPFAEYIEAKVTAIYG